jgi:uncharacterized LabA/DUF88 family protein
MLVLVDYDNIEKDYTRKGIEYLVRKIVSKIDKSHLHKKGITVRLYGGWYEGNSFTRKAESINIEIVSGFPIVATLSDNESEEIVNCELAVGMLADPATHLISTFREREMPTGIKTTHPRDCGCDFSDCPLYEFRDFILRGVCSVCNDVSPEQFLYRAEQKLVDTMLTCDLLFEASNSGVVVLVSSDDDLWPGIRTSLLSGKKIIQIHGKNDRRQSPYYRIPMKGHLEKRLN